jgi:hypothetical protein
LTTETVSDWISEVGGVETNAEADWHDPDSVRIGWLQIGAGVKTVSVAPRVV